MASRNPPVKDYYAVLGVAPEAAAAEIKQAYRALVQRYHPDRVRLQENVQQAGERMIEINEAFSVLSSKRRRAEHDRLRAARDAPPPSPIAAGPASWDIPAPTAPAEGLPTPRNPDVDHTVAQDFVEILRKHILQQGADLKFQAEQEAAWLWSYLGKTWNRAYWIGLRNCPSLTMAALRETLVHAQQIIEKHKSAWRGNSFVFIVAFHATLDSENALRMCRAFCGREENTKGGNLVHIVVLDLARRRSVLCGKKSGDLRLNPIFSALAVG